MDEFDVPPHCECGSSEKYCCELRRKWYSQREKCQNHSPSPIPDFLTQSQTLDIDGESTVLPPILNDSLFLHRRALVPPLPAPNKTICIDNDDHSDLSTPVNSSRVSAKCRRRRKDRHSIIGSDNREQYNSLVKLYKDAHSVGHSTAQKIMTEEWKENGGSQEWRENRKRELRKRLRRGGLMKHFSDPKTQSKGVLTALSTDMFSTVRDSLSASEPRKKRRRLTTIKEDSALTVRATTNQIKDSLMEPPKTPIQQNNDNPRTPSTVDSEILPQDLDEKLRMLDKETVKPNIPLGWGMEGGVQTFTFQSDLKQLTVYKPKRKCATQFALWHSADDIEKQISNKKEMIKARRRSLTVAYSPHSEEEDQLVIDELQRKVTAIWKKLKKRQMSSDNTKKIRKELKEGKRQRRDGTTVGRPSISEQPGFMETLMKIMEEGSETHRRRSNDTSFQKVTSLTQATKQMNIRGFVCSRSGLYLKTIARRPNSIHGRTHKNPVMIRFCKAKLDARNTEHPGLHFYFAVKRNAYQLAGNLSGQITVIGVDDKCKVQLGVSAVPRQQKYMMCLVPTMKQKKEVWEPQVSLPDHTFGYGDRHNLIPSVISMHTVCPSKMFDPECVLYTGPTSVSIRSHKHHGSNAYTHGEDLLNAFDEPKFASHTRIGGEIKYQRNNNDDNHDFSSSMNESHSETQLVDLKNYNPVLICFNDGGADVSVRHPRVINVWVHIFKALDLDYLMIEMPPAGCSAYNPVERRMSPLTRLLAGVSLNTTVVGATIEDNEGCTPEQIEWKNFLSSMEYLKNVWTGLLWKHPCLARVVVEKMDNSVGEQKYGGPEDVDHQFLSQHYHGGVRHLELAKCMDRSCSYCRNHPLRSDYRTFFNGAQFMPPPVLAATVDGQLKSVRGKKNKLLKDAHYTDLAQSAMFIRQWPKLMNLDRSIQVNTLPPRSWDYWNPDVTDESIDERTCLDCATCPTFTKVSMLKEHRKICHPRTKKSRKGMIWHSNLAEATVDSAREGTIAGLDFEDAHDSLESVMRILRHIEGDRYECEARINGNWELVEKEITEEMGDRARSLLKYYDPWGLRVKGAVMCNIDPVKGTGIGLFTTQQMNEHARLPDHLTDAELKEMDDDPEFFVRQDKLHPSDDATVTVTAPSKPVSEPKHMEIARRLRKKEYMPLPKAVTVKPKKKKGRNSRGSRGTKALIAQEKRLHARLDEVTERNDELARKNELLMKKLEHVLSEKVHSEPKTVSDKSQRKIKDLKKVTLTKSKRRKGD